jgi:hypothetical protein
MNFVRCLVDWQVRASAAKMVPCPQFGNSYAVPSTTATRNAKVDAF